MSLLYIFLKGVLCVRGTLDDLTGKRIGHVTVLERDLSYHDDSGDAWWICKCDCGKIFSRRARVLKDKRRKEVTQQYCSLSCPLRFQERTLKALKAYNEKFSENVDYRDILY